MRSSTLRAIVIALAPPSFAALVHASDPLDDRLTLRAEAALGRVSVDLVGSVYSLKFLGEHDGAEYQIDVGDWDVQHGLLKLRERYSDCYPLTVGGASFRNTAGQGLPPASLAQHATLTNHYISGRAVVLEYTDAPPGNGVHHRRHTLTLTGKMLSVTLEDLDQSLAYLGNYSGFFVGPTAGTEDVRTIPMQGALATPIVMFENGAQHYFLANVIDLCRSNASDWLMPNVHAVAQGGSSVNYTVSTSMRYAPNSAGQLLAPVKDTLHLAISQELADVLIAPTQPPSPYRQQLAHRVVAMLASQFTTWDEYLEHLEQWNRWGMDDLAVYTFAFWSSSAIDAPATTNLGPDWCPARDPLRFGALASRARELGIPFGVYATFANMPLSAPTWLYDPSQIAKTELGAHKVSSLNGVPLITVSASGLHARREALWMAQDYGLTAAYIDIQTYASPSHGSDGDHIDQTAGSASPPTLAAAIAEQKRWMRDISDVLAGPVLGEGSIATCGSNTEWLWAGYVDSVQRVINSGDAKKASLQPLGDPESPTLWPVIPEFELRVMSPLQVNHGNGFYDRFFSRSDKEMTDPATGQTRFPLSEEAMDRYRIYEITYGHAAFFTTNGPFAQTNNALRLADMVKEYYLMRALQERYLGSRVSSIKYLHQGLFSTFERVIGQTETVDSFRDPILRITYANGLELYLNHSAADWPVAVGGVAYVIPEDGFVAHQPSTGFVAFSAVPPGTAGRRIDYCYSPGDYEFFDGRGEVGGYGGVAAPDGRLAVDNYLRGILLREKPDGSLDAKEGVAPAVVGVEIVVPPSLAAGERLSVQAIAHFASGGTRDVTTLLSWSSSNPSAATVNVGGALLCLAPGHATLSASSFHGVAPTPVDVAVH